MQKAFRTIRNAFFYYFDSPLKRGVQGCVFQGDKGVCGFLFGKEGDGEILITDNKKDF